MAMVLNEKYKDISPIHFYKSRFFRLFPVYYVGLVLSLLVSFGVITSFFNQLSIGSKFFFIFQNLFIFGQDLSYSICPKTIINYCANAGSLTINPPAWSLAVELGFYLIAPFVLKSAKKTYFYILIGCIYSVSINTLVFPIQQIGYFRDLYLNTFIYYSYASSFIYFGGGALAYHLNKKMSDLRITNYVVTIATIILLSFTQTMIPFWQLFFFSLAIPVVFSYTSKNNIDRIIGELS
jgi:peptidoglycan/LPS O-acetylase OafA/YrhL